MARVIRSMDDEIYVEYGTLVLGGEDLESWNSPRGWHFTALIRMEAWDAEPPSLEGSWEPVDRVNFVAENGVVQMGSMMDANGREFLIGPPYFEYGLTMHYEPSAATDEDEEEDYEERWLLRFWPVRDAFDPLTHMAPPRTPGPDASQDERKRVPVSAAGEWAAMRSNPPGPSFEELLRREEKRLARKGITIYEWLRSKGVDIEDGAELTPDTVARPEDRPGRFADPAVDRYYAQAERRGTLPPRFPDWTPNEQEARLRQLMDDERIADGLNPDGAPQFEIEYEQGNTAGLSPGLSRRFWRWETDAHGGSTKSPLTVDRQIHAQDPLTQRVFVSGVLTILRPVRYSHRENVFVARPAEPHEASRVLCAEATWRDREPSPQ